MNTDFNEMVKEYEKSIDLLSDGVADVRAQRKIAKEKGDKELFLQLSKKLAVMYAEIRDMRIIAEKLRHYYDDCDYDINLTEAC